MMSGRCPCAHAREEKATEAAATDCKKRLLETFDNMVFSCGVIARTRVIRVAVGEVYLKMNEQDREFANTYRGKLAGVRIISE
jgi:hypothetical protein